MGSRMGIDPIRPPKSLRRSARGASRLGRVLLGVALAMLRSPLVALIDIFIMLGRLVLWFRRLLFWLGLLTLASSTFEYSASHKWIVWVTAGGGLVMIAMSRASLLLDDKLRFGQLELNVWAQGWPPRR